MKKTRNILMAALASLALLFGLAGATAPATAASNTTVRYDTRGAGVSAGATIKITNMNGTVSRLAFGDQKRGVTRVCPPGPNTYLTYRNPRGSNHQLAKGQCTGVSLGGTYYFGLHL